MKKSLILTLICIVVSLSLIFVYNQNYTKPWTPVLQFIQSVTKSNGNRTCLRDDEKEHRVKRNGTDSKISGYGKGCENENEERKQPQKTSATRKNLIILSPGRGGSSFLGSLFDSNPRVMYCFEPLFPIANVIFKVNLVRGASKQPKNYREACIKVIDSFLQCDFSNFSRSTLSAFKKSKFHLHRSKALSSKKQLPQFSSFFLNKACNAYNHTVIKILTARVPNKTVQTLKELFEQQTQYDVKMVHLVRDPRAVFHSRAKLNWMKNASGPSFHERIQEICDAILQNVRLGLLLPPPWLKNRFKVIRYEDLVVNTVNITRDLYRFAGFDWSADVDKWITAQADSKKQEGAYSLFRNVSAAMNSWKNAPKPFIKAVEDACSDLMDFLGYEKLFH